MLLCLGVTFLDKPSRPLTPSFLGAYCALFFYFFILLTRVVSGDSGIFKAKLEEGGGFSIFGSIIDAEGQGKELQYSQARRTQPQLAWSVA